MRKRAIGQKFHRFIFSAHGNRKAASARIYGKIVHFILFNK
jgi:hypothetical protein